jgi:hypothetical protein
MAVPEGKGATESRACRRVHARKLTVSVRTTQLSSLTGKIVASRARVNVSQGPARERLEQKIRKLEEEKRATLGGLHLEDHDNVSLKLHSMGMDLTALGSCGR